MFSFIYQMNLFLLVNLYSTDTSIYGYLSATNINEYLIVRVNFLCKYRYVYINNIFFSLIGTHLLIIHDIKEIIENSIYIKYGINLIFTKLGTF